jgi:hypothetical protein
MIWGMNKEASNFIYLIVEEIKRAKVKTLNYSQVTNVQQDPDGSPSAFLPKGCN